MKKLFLGTFAIAILTSCGAAVRTMFGATEHRLIKTVAIEHNCSEDSVKIINKTKRVGNATYSLDACGKRVVYKQVGSVFTESKQMDSMLGN